MSASVLAQGAGSWPQFAGPARDFHAPPVKLAAWDDAGPRTIWTRPLGEGFSGIAVRGDTLYTMYRRGAEEVVIALAAATGHTRWEHAAAVAPNDEQDLSQGSGPHATPLVIGDTVCVAGVTAVLRCVDAATGRLRWTRDLTREFGATKVFRGYSSSPLASGDLVIVQAGGTDHAVIAFDRASGAVRWHGGTHTNANASPIALTSTAVGSQVIGFFSNVVAGFDRRTGAPLWSQAHPQRFADSITLPILVDGDVVVSSPLDGGTRRIAPGASDRPARERWHQPRLGVYYTNIALVTGMVLGSHGGLGPTFFTAIDAASGELLWQNREIKRSNFVVTGTDLVMRDEEGGLVLARPTRQGVTVLASAQILAAGAPSPPTLVGTILFVRDRQRISGFDLSAR